MNLLKNYMEIEPADPFNGSLAREQHVYMRVMLHLECWMRNICHVYQVWFRLRTQEYADTGMKRYKDILNALIQNFL